MDNIVLKCLNVGVGAQLELVTSLSFVNLLLYVRRTDGENLKWPYIGVPSDYPQPGPSGVNKTSD